MQRISTAVSTPSRLGPGLVLVVVGTVAPRPTESVLTIKATGIYRVDG